MRHLESGYALGDASVPADTGGFLRGLPFLRPLPDRDVGLIALAAERQLYEPGALVLREGERSDALYVVYAGAVEVVKSVDGRLAEPEDAEAALSIHRIERGSVFGEMSFVDGDAASATIRAAGACELLCLRHEALHGVGQATGEPLLERLHGAVAPLVVKRLRRINEQHVEALRRELREIRLRHHFERFFIATMVLFAIASLVQRLIQADTAPWLHMAFSWGFLLLSVAPMAWFALRQKRPPSDFGLTLDGWRPAVLQGAGLAVAIVGMGSAAISVLVRAPGEPLWTWGSVADYTPRQFAVFLVGYPLHALLQEFIGRGVIQGSLRRFLPQSPAYVPILLTSCLFGVYHLYVSVPFALLTVLVSMLFGWLYERHRTLVGVTLLHAGIGIASTALGLN